MNFLHTGFVLVRSNFRNAGLLYLDDFVRLVVPPGHVIVTSFAYFNIACHYAQLSVYSARRTARNINTEKANLCHYWSYFESGEMFSRDLTVYGTDVVEVYLYYDSTGW